MSDKQSLLKVVESLPDSANWGELTDALLGVVARRGSADFVRLYHAQFTVEQLVQYLNPRPEYALAAVLAELEAQPAPRALELHGRL